jgi:glutamyl-tRNA synthetase
MERALIVAAPAPAGVRFAPSPTGRFHVGNLRTAWVSHRLARAWKQPWVVRFEDIDAPRVLAGSQESQLADMAALGLVPDQVLIQSAAHERHWETFARAVAERRVYPCFCSRKDVREALEAASSAPHPHLTRSSAETCPSGIYSGHCRALQAAPAHALPSLAWRFAVAEDPSGRSDFIVARTSPVLPADRSSFAPAYHWACAVDDWDGRYHTLVRAADLAEVVPQHRAIMRWLAQASGKDAAAATAVPAVFHASLVTQNDGHRLEKRTRGVTLPELLASGWTCEGIIGRFTASWDARLEADWAPSRVFGEPASSLQLEALGL